MKLTIEDLNLEISLEWEYKHNPPGYIEKERFQRTPTNGATICKVTVVGVNMVTGEKTSLLFSKNARCHYEDKFDKDFGRKLSLKRTLNEDFDFALLSMFDIRFKDHKRVRTAIWKKYLNRK